MCMLYKIRCSLFMVLYQCRMYHAARVTSGALVAHGYTYAPPRCRTSQDLHSLSLSLWNDLADPVFDGVGLEGFKSKVNAFFIGLSCFILFCLLLIFPFYSFCLLVGIVGLRSLN